MRPVSAEFLRTLRGSHKMVARARMAPEFQNGVDPTGEPLPVIGGDVTFNATADIRGTLELETDYFWPSHPWDLLTPYGNELFVERGVQFGNGRIEWVSLGYYRILSPEQDQAPDGPIRIQGQDRMAGLIDGRLTAPRQFLASATYGSVVENLVYEVYPDAVIEWDDSTETDDLDRVVIAEEDRYGFLHDLITSVGKIWHWDHRGVLVIKDPPDPANPVWDVDHGEDGVLVNLSRRLTREGVYNAVVATGEAGDTIAPARAVAYNNDPSSPTYYFGQFGPVPRFYSSPFITTNAQALSAAQSILKQYVGLPYSVNFQAIPNPALEPFDPVRVTYPRASRQRSGIQEIHVVDQIVVPLSASGVMTAATREQSTLVLGSE